MSLTAKVSVLIFAAVILVITAAHSYAAMPLVFDSELIQLAIEGDTLRISGLYRFINRSKAPRVSLFYPYPVDSLLGAAWTESLEWRPSAADPWRPVPFAESGSRPGMRWRLPFAGAERPEVRTVYCQLMRQRYARYIVTTTSAWDRPLRHARFEVTLPPGAVLTNSSYDFENVDGELWAFEAEAFQPEVDIIVNWEFPEE
ncbi:MAG: hypothetical protein GY835_04580 [bacterium]|nr:hypothetical protein [bacterium]